MTLPLPVAGTSAERAQTDWAAFVRRREALVAHMEMATCDGCDGCGHRCTSGFRVTREEYLAVLEYLKTLPPEEVARVLGQEKTSPWPGVES